MTKFEYEYCEERWKELFSKKLILERKLKALNKEMHMLNTKVFKSSNPIADIPFPYDKDIQ